MTKKITSRLEIKNLLHDATWSTVPSRENVIDEFIDRLNANDIPDVENFKVTIGAKRQ